MAFPTTGIIDHFDRANTGPPPSANWSAESLYDGFGACSLLVVSNACANSGGDGGYYNTVYGPDSENYVTWTTLPANNTYLEMYVRGDNFGGTGSEIGYAGRFTRLDSNPGFRIQIFRRDPGVFTQLGSNFDNTAGAISAGIRFGVEIIGSDITTYYDTGGGWTAADTQTDAVYAGAGYLAFRPTSTALVFDNFGGGTWDDTPTEQQFVISGYGAC